MSRRATISFVLAAFCTLALVLWLDRPGLSHQLFLSAIVTMLLGMVFSTHPELMRETLIAIAIATTGEVTLSIGLGIYSYSSGGVPLYVPPGHGVVYLMALQTSAHLVRYERIILRTTFIAGTVAAVGAVVAFDDTFGLACWGVTLLIAAVSQRRLLIATCIAYTSVLEIAGTWAGNWTWHEQQGLLQSGNPPAGVVLLYCCLDLLTLAALRGLSGLRRPVPEPAPVLSMEAALAIESDTR
ncbi:MAG: hypothetical protein ACYC7A_21125 [Thermoanaerobaculia bacterium]